MNRLIVFIVFLYIVIAGFLAACAGTTVVDGQVPTPYYLFVTPESHPGQQNLPILPAKTSVPELAKPISTEMGISTTNSIPESQKLLNYFLELINAARRENGVTSVVWDDFAAQVGQAHAQEMAVNQYMSHWNLMGYGPDVRYSLAGGRDYVMENVYSYWQRYDNGTPVSVDNWQELVDEAHTALMNSPGHRANILMPEHTHVGIGIAYDAAKGEFRMAQEFVNRYVELEALPSVAKPGQVISVKGQLSPGSTQPLINLAFEPEPQPMSIAYLNTTKTYTSSAKFVEAYNVQSQLDNSFQVDVTLGTQPGLYHIRIWVQTQGLNPQVVDWIIRVQQ